jgi:hypothetical protein
MILAQNSAQETVKVQAASTSQVTDANTELKEKIYLAIDAEWVNQYNLDLCCTMSIQSGPSCVFLNSHIQDHVSPEVFDRIRAIASQWAQQRGVKLYWLPIDDQMDLINYFLFDVGVDVKNVNLRMFYSPKDLSIGFGFDQVKDYYKRNSSRTGIQQRRNVSGYSLPIGDRKFTIMDLKGLQPIGGLKDLAKSVGYEMQSKSDMDEYKSNMLEGLIQETEKFLDYSLADAEDLHDIHDQFNYYVRVKVCKDILGVEFIDEIPMTTGSLVGKVFQQWIHTLAENKNAFEFAIRKLGLLNSDSKTSKHDRVKFNNVIDSITSVAELDAKPEVSLDMSSIDFQSIGYSQASVLSLARNSTTAAFNSLVHGGRCNNEFPYAYSIDCAGADIDLKSCYGTSLKQFVYPIGLPTLWGFTENQKRFTLKQWLDKNEADLHPGLWQVVVSGELPFSQDLIYSKLVLLNQIHKAAFGGWEKDEKQCGSDEIRDQDLKHIPGEFVLIREELENGIITSDLLQAIRRVSTARELNAWMKLEVVCAAGYRISDQVEDLDEWSAAVISDRGLYETVKGNAALIKDERTRKWVGIPIGAFIEPLVNKRLEIKELAKTDKDLKSLDLMLKLFINILYGCLASIYFPIGNAVVANNITGRARLGAWMINKALWTRQSITDGGIYQLSEVPFLCESGPLPGFDVLSDRRKWIDRRRKNRTIGSLGNIDWNSRVFKGMTEDLKELSEWVDQIALQHINHFWGSYGLQLPFNVEHKEDHFFIGASYWAKAHYALDLVKPCLSKYTGEVTDRHFIIRGVKTYTAESGLKMSPMFDLLSNILNGNDEFPIDMTYDHRYLMRVGKYALVQNSSVESDLKEKRPGDEVIESRTQRFNNTHFPVDLIAEYRSRFDRKTTKVVKKVKEPVQLFEKFRQQGISFVHQMMMADRLK